VVPVLPVVATGYQQTIHLVVDSTGSVAGSPPAVEARFRGRCVSSTGVSTHSGRQEIQRAIHRAKTGTREADDEGRGVRAEHREGRRSK